MTDKQQLYPRDTTARIPGHPTARYGSVRSGPQRSDTPMITVVYCILMLNTFSPLPPAQDTRGIIRVC